MPAIREVRELPVKDITVGDGQVRTRGADKDIAELAASIRLHGLLEPIVVCAAADGVGFEVLMGQRRLLAHRLLEWDQITAAVIDERVDVTTAKVLSLTENVLRRDLDSRDLIDACTALFNKYGTARAVAEETGLPYAQVLRHVKYDRLGPALQKLVDSGKTTLDIALKAQDAATLPVGVDEPLAAALASGLADMTNVQRRQVLAAMQKRPGTDIAELLAEVNGDQAPKQVVITVSAPEHRALRKYAKRAHVTLSEAAQRLLVSSLVSTNDTSITAS